MEQEIMTLKEVAKYLNLAESTLKKWKNKKVLPFPYINIRSSIRIRKKDVDKYINKNSVNQTKKKNNSSGSKPKVPDLAKQMSRQQPESHFDSTQNES